MVFNKNHSNFQTLLPVTSILLALRFVPDFEEGRGNTGSLLPGPWLNAVGSTPQGPPALAGQEPHVDQLATLVKKERPCGCL